MYQVLGGFILGAFAIFLLFFFDPDVIDDLHHLGWGHGGRDLAAAFAQPFAMAANDDPFVADDVWSDAPAAYCEAVLAVVNRTDHPLAAAMAVRYRDSGQNGGLQFADGSDTVELAPGAELDRVVREAGIQDPRACDALNASHTLVVQAEICAERPGGGTGDCRDVAIDPQDYAPPSQERTAPGRGGATVSENAPAGAPSE